MRRFIDLHAHSHASDGQLAPVELVRLAEAKKLAAVSLTDHDTIAGLPDARAAAAQLPSLRFINGLELSAVFPAGTLHILAYAFDRQARSLAALTGRLRAARNQRNPKMLAKLQALGFDVTMDELVALAGLPRQGASQKEQIVGRPHMALLLMRKGCVRSVEEAFKRYLGDGRPAYVDKERIAPRAAIAAIHDAGGLAVLAHPVQLRCENRAQLERVVRQFVRDGIDGIECYHTDHTPGQTRLYLELARRFKLGVTGGSDFHGPARLDARLGRPRVPLAAIPDDFAQRLLAGP